MPPHPASLTPEERAREVARILAAGLLRLAASLPSPPDPGDISTLKNLLEISLNWLELPPTKSVNGHTS
jgi:hypothetical protein